MAHIKPIVINKMSELSENNMYISVYCDSCELWRDIDPEVWLDEVCQTLITCRLYSSALNAVQRAEANTLS